MTEFSAQLSPSVSQASVSGSSSMPKAENAHPAHIPASISQTTTTEGTSTQLSVQGALYQLAAIDSLKVLPSPHNPIQVLLEASTLKALVQGQRDVSVTLLGSTIQTILPTSLQILANQNGVSNQQLSMLASRAQGYPLGFAKVEQGKLMFENGTSVPIAPKLVLPKGSYLVSINQQDTQLTLKLTSVQGELVVNLAPKIALPVNSAPSTPQSPIIVTRDEPGQLLSQWMKKLEATSFNDKTAPVASAKTLTVSPFTMPVSDKLSQSDKQTVNLQQQIADSAKYALDNPKASTSALGADKLKTENPLLASPSMLGTSILGIDKTKTAASALTDTKAQVELAPIDVLQKALSKTGAMPSATAALLTDKNNLASQLLKLLPTLASLPITQYADPRQLQSQLASLAHLNLAQTQLPATPPFTGEAVTTLFQLLLGFRAHTSGKEISSKLQLHMQRLSQHLQLKMGQHLLSALDKSGSLESLSQLATSLSLYQQASSDPNQNLIWYFALPYGINQREEQLEGKFEQEKDNDSGEQTGWRLQLKFNLTQGPLLINAHRQNDTLALKFSGTSQALLDRINQYQTPLTKQMAQLGFVLKDFNTQIASIPPTLLPGDHYLVKTKA